MFKAKFKYYKNKANTPNLEDLERDLCRRENVVLSDNAREESFLELGLKDPKEWDIFDHAHHSGLLLVKNAFSNEGQQYWINRCIFDYPAPPNLNNLTPLGLLGPNDNWSDICMKCPERLALIHRKLRWVTLGYHHDWDTKIYSEKSRSPFPEDLARLSRIVARVATGFDFNAEAAIVNYYYHNSTISGHVDHSEPNLDAPLLSFSFGDSALFLIGCEGQDRANIENVVSPVLLKSGDIAIMSGPSRLAIHGVPRIIPAEERPWEVCNASKCPSEKDKFAAEFINEARINMNVRQVLYPGSKSLSL